MLERMAWATGGKVRADLTDVWKELPRVRCPALCRPSLTNIYFFVADGRKKRAW
jgi:hypothetical protein